MATIGPAHIDIVGWGNVKAASGAMTRTQSSAALTGGYSYAAGGAVNNYMTWDVPLIAGTWTVTFIYHAYSDRGIVTASIDGVDLSPTVDQYNVATTPNNVAQWTGVSVATPGVKEFKLRAASKNASASAYYITPQLINFTSEDDPTTSFTCTGPSRIDIIPFGYWGMSAGAEPLRTQASGCLSGGELEQSSNAANEVGWYVPLTAGTWALDVIYWQYTNSAIFTVSIDGTTVGTIDTYGASTANVVGTITGITVASSKMALVKFAASTKNASSTGYAVRISHIALRKTA